MHDDSNAQWRTFEKPPLFTVIKIWKTRLSWVVDRVRWVPSVHPNTPVLGQAGPCLNPLLFILPIFAPNSRSTYLYLPNWHDTVNSHAVTCTVAGSTSNIELFVGPYWYSLLSVILLFWFVKHLYSFKYNLLCFSDRSLICYFLWLF